MSTRNLQPGNIKNTMPKCINQGFLVWIALVGSLLAFPLGAKAESPGETSSARQVNGGQPVPPPILLDDGRSAWSEFLRSNQHSAFAIGGNGSWGRSWGQPTVQQARDAAQDKCSGDCEVVAVDGVLLQEYPAADPEIPPVSLSPNGVSYWRYYTSRPGNKAFAMSNNGRFGVATRRGSVKAAREAALDYCNDGRPQSYTNCAIVSVNGLMFNNVWLEAGLNPPPILSESGRDLWRFYHMLSGHKAFYATPNGRHVSYSSGWDSLPEANRAALSKCGSGCEPFSQDGATVKFYMPITTTLAVIPTRIPYSIWSDYVNAPGHKALAVGRRGGPTSVTRQVTVDDARRKAVAGCGSGCAIIALDNSFVDASLFLPPPSGTDASTYLQPPSGLSLSGRVDWEIYLLAYGHKAFAMNNRGGYGYSFSWPDPLEARRRALAFCGSSCQIVSVNNDFRGSPPRSDNFEIVQSTTANAGKACNNQSQCPSGTTCTDVSVLRDKYPSNALDGKVCMPSNPIAMVDRLQSLEYDVCTAFVGGKGTKKVVGFSDMARELNVTIAFGAGYGGNLVFGGTTEAGFVIGPAGQAGCYISQCIGAQSDIQGSAYESLGIYDDWENVPGQSWVFTEGASVPFVEAGVSDSEVLSSGKFVGFIFTFSAGLGVVPVNLSAMSCNTGVVQIRPTLQRWTIYAVGSQTSKKAYRDHWDNWAPTGP